MPEPSAQASGGAPAGTSADAPSGSLAGSPPRTGSRFDLLITAYTATSFLSALLLFSLQPMFAKMVLPVLGGSPSVWAVAVFFFQTALLVGYCYAHALITKAPAAATGPVHLGVCVAAFLTMPIGLPAGWSEPPPGEPYLWQLGLFTVAIGLPFLAIAGNAPLLQAWLARTGHPQGRDPYFLYAASNLGSLIALLSYPFVLEPTLGLRVLSRMWALGFLVLIAALGFCYALLAAQGRGEGKGAALAFEIDRYRAAGVAEVGVGWPRRLGWIGLALVPSALLIAFTTHLTMDVASAPLLWVLPLSLYLLTFVLAFRERPILPWPVLRGLQLFAVVLALLVLSQTKYEDWYLTAGTGVGAFFASALIAHRTLYEARPAARKLTEFYLCMALGGALGGLSSALIAPKVFSEVLEYPLLLVLTVACQPGVCDLQAVRRTAAHASVLLKRPWFKGGLAPRSGLQPGDRQGLLVLWVVLAVGLLALYWVSWVVERVDIDTGEWGTTPIVVAVLLAILLAAYKHPAGQLVAALLAFYALVSLPSAVKRGDAQRSYFGVYRVQMGAGGEYRTLVHGTTLHGAQRVRDSEGNPVFDTTPATYYYPNSPMAETIARVRDRLGDKKGRYGVTGLGTGSLACHSRPGEAWRFFEIDPVIVDIASDPRYFTFLSACQPKPDIVLGDARLTLAKEAEQSFDLIIVDAFSSDAVPVHLLTREAMMLYLEKLRPDGIVLLHISNRNLDLDSVLGATAPTVPGMHGFIVSDDAADGSYAQSTSTVGLFGKSEAALAPFRTLETAAELNAGGLKPWTDDYSDILGPFLNKRGYRRASTR